MAKKKKNAVENGQLDPKDEFEDELVSADDVDDVDAAGIAAEGEEANDHLAELSEILANPDKALGIKPEESDENEVVLYCPNCGVTGLFVDNVCMNCGVKKSKKSYNNAEDAPDDLIDFDVDDSISIDEF